MGSRRGGQERPAPGDGDALRQHEAGLGGGAQHEGRAGRSRCCRLHSVEEIYNGTQYYDMTLHLDLFLLKYIFSPLPF